MFLIYLFSNKIIIKVINNVNNQINTVFSLFESENIIL
jgi:hypothetical protein